MHVSVGVWFLCECVCIFCVCVLPHPEHIMNSKSCVQSQHRGHQTYVCVCLGILITDVTKSVLVLPFNPVFFSPTRLLILLLVIHIAGNLVDETEILAHLQYILSKSDPTPSHPLGLLTTADRDTWTKARIQLLNAGRC